MRCRVYPLRRRGRRLPWREIGNGPSFEGVLSTHYLTLASARYFVAKLVAITTRCAGRCFPISMNRC